MAELHPVVRFLIGVATVGAALGVVGIVVDVVFRDHLGKRVHELLLEASAFTWSFGAFVVIVFVAWAYIIEGMLFEAASFGLLGAMVLYLFVFFLYPEATDRIDSSGEAASDGGGESRE
jgi:ABC-type Fe3+-siderophore transport system permease subunit